MPAIFAYMIDIKVLETPIATHMEKDKDGYNLGIREPVRLVPVLFTILNGVLFHRLIEKFAEIICHTKNFSNFVVG